VRLLILAALLGAVALPALAADPIEVRIRDHRFHPDVVEVPAGQKARLLVINEDSEPEEFESTDLNREKLIRAGASATIFLPPLEPGEYPFYGEFHADTAQGTIVVK